MKVVYEKLAIPGSSLTVVSGAETISVYVEKFKSFGPIQKNHPVQNLAFSSSKCTLGEHGEIREIRRYVSKRPKSYIVWPLRTPKIAISPLCGPVGRINP